MQTTKLAFRNLRRNRRRTFSTLCAIVIGAAAILLFGGYNQSIEYSLRTTFVRDIGHLQIQNKDYLLQGTANPQEYSLGDYQKVMDIITADPVLSSMVNVCTPILLMNGIASNYSAGTSRPVLIYGTESSGQQKLIQWDEYHLGENIQHRQILNISIENAALMGKGLNRLLQVDNPVSVLTSISDPANSSETLLPDDLTQLAEETHTKREASNGKSIELLTASTNGAPNIIRAQVVGVQPQPARELDDSYINLHLKQAQQLLFGQGADGATAIVLQLHHSEQIEEARKRIQQLLASSLPDEPLVVLDFTQLQPLYPQILAMFGTLFHFLLVIILCITLFTISNTMSMAVLERTIEIGTLRAIGLKQRNIQQLFLNEGLFIGAIGSILGLVFSLFIAHIINLSGLTWQPPGVISPIPIHIKIWGEWRMIMSVIYILMMAAILSSWWPSRRAANVSIVQALRHT